MNANDVPVDEDDLQAFIDDRLDANRRSAVEAHLAAHPDIAGRIAVDRRQRAILRSRLEAVFAEPIPTRLRIANLRATPRTTWTRRWTGAAAAATLFMAGAAAGWFAHQIAPAALPLAPTISVAQGAQAAYRTFVVEVAHPVEVGVQQETHLLQWLSKRLGRKLAAPDLSPFGYSLMGGRLLPGGSGAAAQLMYDDASGRRLTIYLRAVEGQETAFRFHKEGEAATFAWIDQGFGFAVTATATREELLPVAEAVYRVFEGKS